MRYYNCFNGYFVIVLGGGRGGRGGGERVSVELLDCRRGALRVEALLTRELNIIHRNPSQ